MDYFVLWALGFGIFWLGLRFDDEVLVIVSALVGSILVIWGLTSAPLPLQLFVEVSCVVALSFVCMRCIERGS
ncbi:hypothetical protein [Pseudanabaena sp. FACHB-2040]|uniref:hypothetical protein n=1 Tax=Pseudanabaena sp. FACHB-2040 TaxID=2692859 RepID=UPI001686FF05|nr:hypothetical protein [Pseudanabaena sp. FACHB-2040]MBD2256677.1 hypothetical protein [Pseudanabaena sp. FACHB-2040]